MKSNNIPQTIAGILLFIVMVVTSACSDEPDYMPKLEIHEVHFTDNTDFQPWEPEVINVDDTEQTIRLTAQNHEDYDLKMAHYSVGEWDDEKQDWAFAWDSSYGNAHGTYYHISTDESDRKFAFIIKLKTNDTDKDRKLRIHVMFEHDDYVPFGLIEIVQAASPDTKPFVLTAKYKGSIYTTTAQHDSDGNFVFFNEAYKKLMDEIDSNPSAQMAILNDSTVYYYDDDDILSNAIYSDIQSIMPSKYPNRNLSTRANGFENIGSDDLGYMALYDNDNFNGKMFNYGLTNFHFTCNLQDLKIFGLNDKITSIAIAYNGDDPIVCTVLTIWEDTDYNFKDNDRKKHRISLIASQNSRRVTCPDLKKIKKIGSSKSWNDCISSVSLHFGYIDRLLKDY